MSNGVLLDADVPPAVAVGLRQRGHDVIASSGDPALEALTDVQLLRESTRQRRGLVTFNIVDFVEMASSFASTRENHTGIILIHSRSYRRTDIGAIIRALDHLLRSRESFINNVLYLARNQS